MTELIAVNRIRANPNPLVAKSARMCALLYLAFLSGCGPSHGSRQLSGEWVIQITAESYGRRNVADRSVTGVLVFNSSLPVWAEQEQIRLPAPHVPGRLFAPIRRLTENPPQDTVSAGYYRPHGGISLSDEVVANVSGSRVDFVLAPGVVGGRYEFSGVIRGDTVHGQWKLPPHPTGMTGRFRMWKAPAPAALDSARTWARRVGNDASPSQVAPIDTMK
jgi:hypothetical protein